MNKKGFTLTELLVVIAIIGILSVLIIPNVVKVNENINERTLEQRKELIIDAAELYADNHPDIFDNQDSVEIRVSELLAEKYLEADANDDTCDYSSTKEGNPSVTDKAIDNKYKVSTGCVTDPTTSASMNDTVVVVTKKKVGVEATIAGSGGTETVDTSTNLLVYKVCKGFDNNNFIGKYGEGENERCYCRYSGTDVIGFTNTKGGTSDISADACILVSKEENGNINNWVKYGSSSANWRVVGLYKVPKEGGSGSETEIVAKLITNSLVD